MKLLDAGEVLPDTMVLDLIAEKLASSECQQKGWVLEGVGTAASMEGLEEAIVMATEVTNGHGDQRRLYGGTPHSCEFAAQLLSCWLLRHVLTRVVTRDLSTLYEGAAVSPTSSSHPLIIIMFLVSDAVFTTPKAVSFERSS